MKHLILVLVSYYLFLGMLWSTDSDLLKKSVIPKSGCYTGAYPGDMFIKDFEDLVGKKVTLVSVYLPIDSGMEDLPIDYIKAFWKLGHYTVCTMELNAWTLQEMIDGKHDGFFKKIAVQAKKLEKPFFLRWMQEMNGNNYAWSGTKNGGSQTDGYGNPSKADGPERFVDAWRHIYKIFDKEGVKNAIWVWCPNEDIHAGSWNNIENYYPGDEYVDWLSMDAYNWGTKGNFEGTKWRGFSEIFRPIYNTMEKLNKDKPMLVGEFASTESGGNKAEWIKDAFKQIKNNFPKIKGFIYFGLYKETDWNLDSSDATLDTFYEAMKDPYFLEHKAP
jgi:beta-mannanase